MREDRVVARPAEDRCEVSSRTGATLVAAAPGPVRRAFPIEETHGIAGWHQHRLLDDSSARQWPDAYTSHVRESPWEASLLASRHPCIALCTAGSARIRRAVEGDRTTTSLLGTRQFGIVPPDRASTWYVDGTPDVQHIYLRREMFDEVVSTDLGLEPSAVELDARIGVDDPLLEQLAAVLLRAVDEPDAAVVVAHAARLIALHLARHHSNRAGTTSVRRARLAPRQRIDVCALRDHIDANLDGDLSLASLACAAGVTTTTLASTFSEQNGVTLHQFVLQRRLARACELLATTRRPLAEVAVASGFAHQSHMTNTFRRKIGITPAAYRRERS